MDSEKIKVFFDCYDDAFRSVVKDMADLDFSKTQKAEITEDKKFSVIIGTVGRNRGRIVFEAGANTVKMITESMNGEPIANVMDIYLFLAEFVNIFSGNAVTAFNNKFKGTELRLTPPAVFSGTNMEIETPNIGSTPVYYTGEYGTVILDIGFEEVSAI